MDNLKKALRTMIRNNPKAAEELLEAYVTRPSYVPPGLDDNPMTPEEVAFREGERSLAMFLINLADEEE